MEGLFLFTGLFSVVLFLVPTGLLLGLLVVFVIRTDDDLDGSRGAALYLSMASFVALFVALAAAVALSTAVVDLVADDDRADDGFTSFVPDPGFDTGSGSFSEEGFEVEPDGSFGFGSGALAPDGDRDAQDRAISAAVASVIVLGVAGAILAFHLPRLGRFGAAHLVGTGGWRVRRSYRLVTCLTAVLLVLVAASLALYGVYALLAPGTAGTGDRGDAVEQLVPVIVLLAGAAVIFGMHWDDEGGPRVTAEVAP